MYINMHACTIINIKNLFWKFINDTNVRNNVKKRDNVQIIYQKFN